MKNFKVFSFRNDIITPTYSFQSNPPNPNPIIEKKIGALSENGAQFSTANAPVCLLPIENG